MERAGTSNSFKADPALDQQLANNKNPLLNPVILKNLFGLIPFKLEEFKNFRLVSHEWNDCAVHFVHQNSWLKLNGIAEAIFHNYKGIRRHVSLLYSITSCLEESHELSSLLKGTIRFKKYLISNQVIGGINARGLINFWEKFGPRMTHLEISGSTMHAQDLPRIIFELTPNLQVFIFNRTEILDCTSISAITSNNLVWNERFRLPESSINKNLTHLTILNADIEDYEFPINWVDIVSHFPNIKNLKLGFHSVSNRLVLHSLKEFLQAVLLVRQNCGQHYFARLVHLDIIEIPQTSFHQRLPQEILLLLRHLAFPLSALALDVGNNLNEVDRLDLKNTLELHSSSLQNLTLYCSYRQHPYSFSFRLPHLTQLMLIGYNPENLHFLSDLPMLKTFVLLDNHSSVGLLNMKKDWLATYNGRKFEIVNARDSIVYRVLENTNFSRVFRGVILPNLQTLVFGPQLVDWTQIKSLAKLMPNIKTLQLGMGNHGFIMVCRHWSQIEHIHVEPMDIDEDGIFGVKDGEQYRLPNITDLKCLKTISLGYSSQQLRRLSLNLTAYDGAAAVLLPNLEAALNGRNVQVYRQPPTVATSREESDDSD